MSHFASHTNSANFSGCHLIGIIFTGNNTHRRCLFVLSQQQKQDALSTTNQNSIVTRQTATTQSWAPVIYDLLKTHAITLVSYVPDAGHSQLITLCEADPAMQTVSLTTEEEGVALVAGAYLGGPRVVLLMQSKMKGVFCRPGQFV